MLASFAAPPDSVYPSITGCRTIIPVLTTAVYDPGFGGINRGSRSLFSAKPAPRIAASCWGSSLQLSFVIVANAPGPCSSSVGSATHWIRGKGPIEVKDPQETCSVRFP